MHDANLFLRTSGVADLTADVTTSGIAVGPTPQGGLSCLVTVPEQSIGDTLDVTLEHSTDDSTYSTLVTFDQLASSAAAVSTSVHFVRRFETELKYVRAVLNVSGTSPDYGAVQVVIGSRDAWNNLAQGNVVTDPDAGTVA